jgi:hypothetical protein
MTRYCGRDFTDADLDTIRRLLAASPGASRAALSRQVCLSLGWAKPDGAPKAMSCRVAMLRMAADGLLRLPPPRHRNSNRPSYAPSTPATDPGPPLATPVHLLGPLHLDLVADPATSALWNEFIARYHYLGYRPLPGAQLRYIARTDRQLLALLGFGAAAWSLAPRDGWIGWTPQQRERHLPLVVNNARFLILPWIDSRNLASKLLALTTRRLPDDWATRYAYRPVLLETFVDADRFPGTCYRAANWLHAGTTQGRGKLDRHHTARLPRKDIYLFPLSEDFRAALCS